MTLCLGVYSLKPDNDFLTADLNKLILNILTMVWLITSAQPVWAGGSCPGWWQLSWLVAVLAGGSCPGWWKLSWLVAAVLAGGSCPDDFICAKQD